MPARGVRGPIVGVTGTPGTGKTTVCAALRAQGFPVLELGRYKTDARFALGEDPEHHDAVIIDEDALDEHLAEHLVDELGIASPITGPVFIEGHFAHELYVCDRVVVLRCSPGVLKARLEVRGWPEEKVRANVEAEAIDLILQETLEVQEDALRDDIELPVGEIDTTTADAAAVAGELATLATAPPAKLQIGKVDWSGEVLGWF